MIKYMPAEVRPGFIILNRHIIFKTDDVFTVERVIYRRSSGLIFIGHYNDGRSGTVSPHPDRPVRVIGGDESLEPVPWAVTSDYPWAELVV